MGTVQKVFIGTTRKREPDGTFDGGRSEKETFARYDVSIPPDRAVGKIDVPRRRSVPDPQKQFLITNAEIYKDAPDFQTDLRRQLKASGGEAVIFVHGFNTNFAEGIYRIAQFAHDLHLPGTVVLDSWPSAAQPLGYAYDRDSALVARDGLENLINDVAGQEQRLGSLSDVTRLSDLKVTFLDVGAFAKGAGHFVVGDSAALIALLDRITDIQGAFEKDQRSRVGLLPAFVLTVQRATEVVLQPIGRVAQGVQEIFQ